MYAYLEVGEESSFTSLAREANQAELSLKIDDYRFFVSGVESLDGGAVRINISNILV